MNQAGVSARECAAMRILARDGYTPGVLKMTMHLSDVKAVNRHVKGDCTHQHDVSAIPEWDGTAPARLSADDRLLDGEVDA
jgi:hypothetical protein